MRKILVAGGITAAAVATVIGVASTNQITGIAKANQMLGYGSADIVGATVSSVTYTADSSDESKLASVHIVFTSAVPAGDVISIGFGTASPTNPLVHCDDAALTAGAAPALGSTDVVCSTSGMGPLGTELDMTAASKFRLLVAGSAAS